MLVPDSREPNGLLFMLADACDEARIDFPRDLEGNPITTEHDCGDFWLMPQGGIFTIVERKTVTDFESSVVDGRLFKQLQRCVDVALPVGGQAILLIEKIGEVFPASRRMPGVSLNRPGLHPNSVRGAWLAAHRMGVGIIPSSSGDDTVRTLIWLYEKARMEGRKNGGKSNSPRTAPWSPTLDPLGPRSEEAESTDSRGLPTDQ